MYPWTYDKNLEMIQFRSYISFWFRPPGGQAKNQTEPKFGLWITLT
jgi:hypothetical protein